MAEVYYKFVISPTSGDVSLAHNKEGHPASILTHEDLIKEQSDPNLIKGYIIKQPAGYRILDDDYKEITDPFLLIKINEILEKL